MPLPPTQSCDMRSSQQFGILLYTDDIAQYVGYN